MGKEKNIYFIGDTHFGHSNVIRLNKRPFNDINEMNSHMVREWNKVVRKDDIVYILGDFWYRGSESAVNFIRKLNGEKVLIVGNHDNKALKNAEFIKEFKEITPLKEIIIDNTLIVMCHYPILEWNGYFRGSYHIHGHIHNNKTKSFEFILSEERILNAGVDIIGFKPVTFEELKESNKIYKELYKEVN